MAIPWIRLIDAALGLNDVVRRARRRDGADGRQLAVRQASSGAIEAGLGGVVVAALKEAFNRDYQRLEFERQQQEAARARAERALKLELLRQAGDREIGRMRFVAGVALAGWVGTLLVVPRFLASIGGRVTLGFGWALLVSALVCAVAEQSRQARAIAVADERLSVESATATGAAGATAPWLLAAGMVAIAIGVLAS